MSHVLILGDACHLPLADCSVDSVVTDPPAGISFMGKDWDTFPTRSRPEGYRFADGRARPGVSGGQEYRPGNRAPFIAFMTEAMAECLRVLKPGGHALVWAIPRTSHWTATAIEDAGFEVREVVTHLFGQGFPKSLDIARALAKVTGAESHEARQWDGWGTALKPAAEFWILARKPFKGSVAANILAHGTGALNIDGCRVGVTKRVPGSMTTDAARDAGVYSGNQDGSWGNETLEMGGHNPNLGRWPANVILSHIPPDESGDGGCRQVGVKTVQSSEGVFKRASSVTRDGNTGAALGAESRPDGVPMVGYGREEVPAYSCVEGCPVAEIDRQSGDLHGAGNKQPLAGKGRGYDASSYEISYPRSVDAFNDSGGASRFFYVAKADTAERNKGLREMGDRNHHATVKPIDLMRYLCRLVTPPNGIVLDCFMGSGTTGIAALREGFQFIGVEKDREYLELAQVRIEEDAPLFNRRSV